MKRLFNAVAMLVIIAAGIALYQVKYRTQHVQDEVRLLKQQIAADSEAIKVLRAEWTYLSRPDRLEALGSRYLALAPAASVQVVSSLDDIPFREDPTVVVAQVDDFRAVAPQLVRGPAERPQPPAAAPKRQPAPDFVIPPQPHRDENRPLLHVRNDIDTDSKQGDDPLAFIQRLKFVSDGGQHD